MKRSLNYITILSLSLIFFGCSGPTINRNSDEFKFINFPNNPSNGIVTYKGEPFTGDLIKTTDDGQLRHKVTLKDGKVDGIGEDYYENGQLHYKENYKDGEKDGVCYIFFENGQIYLKKIYKDGEIIELEQYYENGQLEKKGAFNDGELDGVWEEYYENGQLKNTYTFGN